MSDTPPDEHSDQQWFLTADERGNPASALPVWCPGNRVEPLIHGSTYFDALVTAVQAQRSGDYLFFTDWRGDPEERLRPAGPTIRELLSDAARRGVVVKGLVWRSHLDRFQFSEEENQHLGEMIEQAGGEVLLDQRVRFGGSHHQKLVVLRHPGRPSADVAFVGGIDLCHSRRDDRSHRGDPQPMRMNPRYGQCPPWHDVQLRIAGPAVGALDTTFRERWNDRAPLDANSPLAWVADKVRRADLSAGELPAQPPDPAPAGPHGVQVLRTYPDGRRMYDFAPHGERSIAHAYTKALSRARRLIYLEDQYLWSRNVAELFAAALRENPSLHLIAIVPRHPDVDGRLSTAPNMIGRQHALDVCLRAGAGRFHVFDVENHQGTPVYVHAKVCVIDDVWACVGSDNFNRRSWTHDSELACAVVDQTRDTREPRDPAGHGDGARLFARELRLRLMREHLDRADDGSADDGLIAPHAAIETIIESARRLEEWYAAGRKGTRPPGRLRPHRPERLGPITALWSTPIYRLVYDPDGRSYRDRLARRW